MTMGEQEPLEEIENPISYDMSINDVLDKIEFPEDLKDSLVSLPEGTVLNVFNDIETGEQRIHTVFAYEDSLIDYLIITTDEGTKLKYSKYLESGEFKGKISFFYPKDENGRYYFERNSFFFIHKLFY